MFKGLPDEILKLNNEIDDLKEKMVLNSDHNCDFPVHKCYCELEKDVEVRNTHLRKSVKNASVCKESLVSSSADSLRDSRYESQKMSQQECPQHKNLAVNQNSEVSVKKRNLQSKSKTKNVYDVDQARVTVEVTQDRSERMPMKLVPSREKKKLEKKVSEPLLIYQTSEENLPNNVLMTKPWGEIFKEQSSSDSNKLKKRKSKISEELSKQVSSRSTQCDGAISRDNNQQYMCPITTAHMLVNELKTKTDFNYDNELKSLIGNMEKTLKRIEKMVSKKNKEEEHMSKEEIFKNKLEQTCQNLEISCKLLEDSCLKLKNERDALKEDLKAKSFELHNALMREIDFKNKLSEANSTVDEMTKKIDMYSQSTMELTEKFKNLQHETKELAKLKKQVASMTIELTNVTRDRDKLTTDSELLKLDRDKLKVLLSIKDEELARLKREVMMIGDDVSKQAKGDFPSSLSDSGSTDLNVIATPSKSSKIFASSKNASSSSESELCRSWKQLSSIISPAGGDRSSETASDVERKSKKKLVMKKPKTVEESNNPQVGLVKITLEGQLPKNSPERLGSLKTELKGLFAEMKRQTDLAMHTDHVSNDLLQTNYESSWSQVSESSRSHSILSNLSD